MTKRTPKAGSGTQGQTLQGYVPGDDPLQAQHDQHLIHLMKTRKIPKHLLLENRGALSGPKPPPPADDDDPDGGAFIHVSPGPWRPKK